MKVWSISLCYNDPAVIRESILQYRRTKHPDVETVHVFVDQHWPIDYSEFKSQVMALTEEVGGVYLDPGRNLGLTAGFNWALGQLAIPDNAGVIGYDPDSWPVTPGWDMAMCRALVSDPELAWISLWHPHADRELLEQRRGRDLGDGKVLVKSAVLNSVCMWSRGWLRECQGIYEKLPYYGGLEVFTFPRLGKRKWVFLKDYREDFWPMPELLNPLYREWKWATTHGGQKQIEFGTWLKQRRK